MSKEKSIATLSDQLGDFNGGKKKALPPVESWNPAYCGEIDIQIKADGSWFHNGTVFTRHALVKLFASVLICENKENKAGEYFLVTPVEKVKIVVDDAPFVLIQWQWLDETQQIMEVMTNIGDRFILDDKHKFQLVNGSLYVNVRRNLLAKVHRNVFYQWADFAKECVTEQGTELVFFSDGCRFSLGVV